MRGKLKNFHDPIINGQQLKKSYCSKLNNAAVTQTELAMIANSKKEERRLKMGEEKSCGNNTCMKELDVCT